MKSLTLYSDKNSIIHKINPINKIMYIVVSILIPIIIPTVTMGLVCLAISILILLTGKVFRKVIPILGVSGILLLSIILIQGLFKADNVTPLFSIGNLIFYREGLFYALTICIRVINVLFGFSILILTTKPSDLIEELVRKGLSPKIGYVLSSVLQIIPEMSSTMETIVDAQRSRGMETEGKLLTRIKAFFPLIGPVVMNSLVVTRERAMALEVRGFNSKTKKSFLNESQSSNYDRWIKLFLILFLVLAVIWRIVLWKR
ncbi:MAG: energy-coupling factor transporter transmembrane protein EcfT [Clostridium argentinense]|uniref:Energy-coupling factor transporter transmembrane protein EcfT n=1 Tax=Clostridium faecium TaxID=2762223 RepID=A0ABR8YRA3_9CLOT|nr:MULTISPECIES: energy-coupling factor transporter transmembrane component T [Clostridium]MBD8046419.1 energy-coupling factor transporter transmembrane protein EcfT [Clostridium faecium]MBS5823117.1 energy-coupling factor transporter transmembrane protein EcfT [Clostridium argentinense]MDU1350369.1 energy-coupling factor transporter transmembrane component T [Clostridium argentinense]